MQQRNDSPADDAPVPPFPPQHQEGVGREADLVPAPRFRAERYKAAGKLEGKVALITGGDSGIGRAVAYLFAREGADVAINYLVEEQDDADATRREVETEGRGCLMLPGDLTDRETCRQIVRQTVDHYGSSGRPGVQRRAPEPEGHALRGRRRRIRPHVQDQRLRVLLARAGGARGDARRQRHHRDQLGDGHQGLAEAAGLLGHEGGDQRDDQGHGHQPHQAAHPRQRHRARACVDPAQSLGCGPRARRSGEVRQGHPDGPARSAGGARARVCLPREQRRLVVHHGHRAAGDGRRDDPGGQKPRPPELVAPAAAGPARCLSPVGQRWPTRSSRLRRRSPAIAALST